MKKMLLLIMAVMLLAVPCMAEEINLFKDFTYGMSEKIVAENAGALPCVEEGLIGSLCAPNGVEFLGEKWEQVFFIEKEKLVQVLLVKEFNQELYLKVVSSMSRNKFVLSYATSTAGQVDGFAYLRKPIESYEQALTEWELASVNAQGVTISFFDQKSIQSATRKAKVTNLTAFIRNAPITTRSVEIKIIDEYLMLSFLAPIKGLRDIESDNEESYESF